MTEETAIANKVTEMEAFEVYLSMGVERSQKKLWELLGERSVALRTIESWSAKNGWVEKADEYDKRMYEETMKLVLKRAMRTKADAVEICRAVMSRFSKLLLGENKIVGYDKSGTPLTILKQYDPTMADMERAYRIVKQELGEGLPDWEGVKEINLTQIFQQIINEENAKTTKPIIETEVDDKTV
jgi:hypothetical protein